MTNPFTGSSTLFALTRRTGSLPRAVIRYTSSSGRREAVPPHTLTLVHAAKRALRTAGYPHVDIEAFQKEALSGDYQHAWNTVAEWCDFEDEDDEDDKDGGSDE